MLKIIDSHTHNYPEALAARAAENLGKFYNFTVEESGTFSRLEEVQRECGVCGFVLLSVATSPKNVPHINDFASERMKQARADGFECAAFGCMHADFPDFEAELDRFGSLGLCGVKIQSDLVGINCDCDRLMQVYESLERRGLALYLHAGDDRADVRFSSPERIANVAASFPKLRIAAAHLGGYREWDNAEKTLMGKYENVWYDCSSTLEFMDAKRGKYLIEKCGTDRVMYASDYPAISPRTSIRAFMNVDFTDGEREDICYNNVRKFIKF